MLHLHWKAAPGVEAVAVGPDGPGSLIGLIIDASIPAGAGQAATNMAGEGQRRRRQRRDGDGGIGANKGRHLGWCSKSP